MKPWEPIFVPLYWDFHFTHSMMYSSGESVERKNRTSSQFTEAPKLKNILLTKPVLKTQLALVWNKLDKRILKQRDGHQKIHNELATVCALESANCCQKDRSEIISHATSEKVINSHDIKKMKFVWFWYASRRIFIDFICVCITFKQTLFNLETQILSKFLHSLVTRWCWR